MFWGSVVKEGKNFQTITAFDKEAEFPVLHISNASLPGNFKGNQKVYLVASMGKDLKNLTIANLQKDTKESQNIDLYIHMS